MPMSGATQRLGKLLANLTDAGAHPSRIEVVAAALSFKRSWLELAQLLVRVRDEGNYRGWGYEDFTTYCQQELALTPATVDKLTVSFNTLHRHAPRVFDVRPDEEPPPIPSYQSLDYFSRALGEPRSDGSEPRNAPLEPPQPEVLDRLRTAVFEEGASVHRLRSEFDPILRPKLPAEQRVEAIRRATATGRRLVEQLGEVEGLSPERLGAVSKALENAQRELDALLSRSELELEQRKPSRVA